MSKLKKALEKAKEERREIEGASEEPEFNAVSPLKKALEKARLESGEDYLAQRTQAVEVAPPAQATYAPVPSPARPVYHPPVQDEIRMEAAEPTLVETRSVQCDECNLRENRIISLFHQEQASDQIKLLRTQILERMKAIGGNSLLITSPDPRAGKTFTSINLAISIAQEVDRTTLLVDADLRNPSIHKYFGFEVQKGLSDYLLGHADIPELLVNPGIPKLTILPGGANLPNSTELLGAPRMEALVKEMKGRYKDRFIIFDSSSLLTGADPLVFSRFIDGVVLVVEAERTSSKNLRRALELLKGRQVLGTVLNKAKGKNH